MGARAWWGAERSALVTTPQNEERLAPMPGKDPEPAAESGAAKPEAPPQAEVKPTPEEIAEQQLTAKKAAEHRARIERLLKEDDCFESLCAWVNEQRAKGVELDTIGRVLAQLAVRTQLIHNVEGLRNLAGQVPQIMENHRKQQAAQAAAAERQRVANLHEARRKGRKR